MEPETAYDERLADWFANHASTSPYNAFIDRPSMLGLIGDCAGQRVLDVGCGAGHYAESLLQRGASVVGIDGSSALLAHAAQRLDGRAELRAHDLERPLTFAADASFDGAVMALVLHHVEDRPQLLRELARVLRPGGWLALSGIHPTADWRYIGDSYFATGRATLPVADSQFNIHCWRLSLEQLMTEVLGAGFVLERLVEPRPLAEYAAIDPERYERLMKEPSTLALRLRRP